MNNTSAIRVVLPRFRLLTLAVAVAAFSVGSTASSAVTPTGTSTTPLSAAVEAPSSVVTSFDLDAWDADAVAAIDPVVLELALGATRCAVSTGAAKSPSTLTIIDYSKPSLEPRMWVLDLDARELLYEELVSHGQGSGGNVATKFSNTPDSHQTSIGLFVTDTTYVGRNGYSLRLDGLDKGFNDRARERAIVMHGAPYVNGVIGKSLGRLGRSHGCPAVRDAVARELIDRVKGGDLVFSYYPDAEWLKTSKYLGTCGA